MRSQLLLVGSSFLPPFKYIWGSLEESFEIHFSNIGNWGEVLESANLKKDVVGIFLMEDTSFDKESSQIEKMQNVLSIIRQRLTTSDKTFLFCFSTYTPSNVITKSKSPGRLSSVMIELQKLCEDFRHFYTIDLDNLFAGMGLSASYSYRNWYFSNSRLTNLAWAKLSPAINKVLTRIQSAPKKILVLDCDNTIWGGIIGEDGISGIALGQDGIGKAFKDFQGAVMELRQTGTLLGLASKNNEEEVWEVFDNHSQMLLKRNDIIVSRIDWSDKASNLLQMSLELDIGLDSFVFWDDNPFERQQVRNHLPEVTTVEPPKAVELWPQFLRDLDLFSNFYVTPEDLDKQNQYRSRLAFQNFQSTTQKNDGYLNKISLSATLVSIDEQNLSRAEQLSMKTNQFNLRSIRLSASEIRDFINRQGNFGYLVHLKDIFGDHGLVALFLVSTKDDIAFVESFNMSCRVFGRKLEYWIVHKIEQASERLGVSSIVFGSRPTVKSGPVISKFFESGLFVRLGNFPDSAVTLVQQREYRLNEDEFYEVKKSLAGNEVRGIYE